MTFAKSEAHKRVKARADRRHAADRKRAVDSVWKRDGAFCVLCQRFVIRPRETDLAHMGGHVDEIIPRSQGGSDTDLENLRLLCYFCHFSGPSGAHRKTVRCLTEEGRGKR